MEADTTIQSLPDRRNSIGEYESDETFSPPLLPSPKRKRRPRPPRIEATASTTSASTATVTTTTVATTTIVPMSPATTKVLKSIGTVSNLQRNLSLSLPTSRIISPVTNIRMIDSTSINPTFQPQLLANNSTVHASNITSHHSTTTTTTATISTIEAPQHYSMPGNTTKSILQESGIESGTLSRHELNGLNIAGVAVTLLTTIFILFHPMFIVHIMSFSSSVSRKSMGGNAITDTARDLLQNAAAAQMENNVDVIAAALIPEENQHELLFEQQNLQLLQKEQRHQQKEGIMLRLIVFCIVNPIIIVTISWLIDYVWCFQRNRKRTDLISFAGCTFAIASTLPFFFPLAIPHIANANVFSVSLFETTYFFISILLTSALTECYNMSTRAKMGFMLSSEVMYLLVSVIACQFGLPHFYVKHENDHPVEQQNLRGLEQNISKSEIDTIDTLSLPDDDVVETDTQSIGSINGFCIFLIFIVLIACTLFISAQLIITKYASQTNRKQQSTSTGTAAPVKLTNAKQSNLHLVHLHDDTMYESDDDLESVDRVIAYSTSSSSSSTTSSLLNTGRAMILKSIATLQRYIKKKLSTANYWFRLHRLAVLYQISPTSQRHFECTKRVLYDTWKHKNFCIWIVTEMLHKAQNSFISYYLYFFMGRMVAGRANQLFHHHLASTTTFSNFGTIFLVSISKQIVTIIAYLPIALVGYRQTYQQMFNVAVGMSVLGFLFADPTSDAWIVAYLLIFTTMTRAMHVASIYLVMSDLVLEMKYKQTMNEHRIDEGPPVAALYLGLNAFFAQPTRVVFAMFAEMVSNALKRHAESKSNRSDDQMFTTDESKRIVFRCLIAITFICSTLQVIVWSKYDLRPKRAAKIRDEIKYTAVTHMLQKQQILNHDNSTSTSHHTRHGSNAGIALTTADSSTAVTNNHPHHQRQTLLHRSGSNRDITVEHNLIM